LSGVQLNATANVPGSLTYAQAVGAVLPAGPQVLSVTFIPSNLTDYAIVTAEVPLSVSPLTGSTQDMGTVTLTVNNFVAATTTYSGSSTQSTVAAGLAAGIKTGSPVTIMAVDDTLYLESTASGAGTDYAYTLQTTSYDSTDFTQPSFAYPPITGNLDGGVAQYTAGAQVYSFNNVTYDGASNVAGYTDSVTGTWSMVGGYDSLNRLSAATQTPTTGSAQSYCWTYDAFGNRTTQATSNDPFSNSVGASGCTTPGTLLSNAWANLSSANNNRLANTSQAVAGVPYDASGDVLSDGTTQYLYDGDGRICAVASSPVGGTAVMYGYLYDAEGTRVAKGSIQAWSCDPTISQFTPTTDYVLGPSGEQVTEMGLDSNNTIAWQHTNVFAGGKLIATYDNDGLHFYLDDPLGTRRAQTDYEGVLEQTCSSLPFGDGLACTGSVTTPTEQHFTGKERDVETGNDYFEARYYSSAVARFLSPDWAAKEEPVPYAKLDSPQSLNLYAYVENNPLTRVDVDGHEFADLAAFANQLKSDAQSFAQSHPMTMGIAKGVGNATLGAATVAVSVGAEVGTGGLSTALSAVGAVGGASLFVKGVTQAVGTATNTDVKQATEALDATRNPAGLLTTVATGGNMQAGDKAATALDVVTAASDVTELATRGMKGDLKIDGATATKLTNVAQTARDAQTALKPTEQKKPDQK